MFYFMFVLSDLSKSSRINKLKHFENSTFNYLNSFICIRNLVFINLLKRSSNKFARFFKTCSSSFVFYCTSADVQNLSPFHSTELISETLKPQRIKTRSLSVKKRNLFEDHFLYRFFYFFDGISFIILY